MYEHALKSDLTKANVGLSNVDNTSDAAKPISDAVQAALDERSGSFNETDVKTSAYTALPNDLVLVDASAAAVAITLPTSPEDKSIVAVKRVDSVTANQLTISAGGSDQFTSPAGTSLILRSQGQSGTWQYNAATHKWTSISSVILLSLLVDNYTNQDIYGKKSFYDDLYVYEGKNIGVGTNTGTKIGTSVNQKLAFYNSVPIVQPSGSVVTALANLGLVSSPTIAQADVTGLSAALSGKQATLTLTTTGTSGAATLSGGALNIPNYAAGGAASPLTTKGDLWVYSTVDARLPVGANGNVLIADSTQALGVKWGALTGGGDMLAATYDPAGIAQQVLGLTATQTGITNKTFSGLAMTDATDIVLGTTTGTKIGTASTQKIGFLGATPIPQRSAAYDLGTLLSDLGFRVAGGSYGISTTGTVAAQGNLTVGGATTIGAGYRATTVSRTASTSITVTSTWHSLCDATSGALTFTLPAASSFNGQLIWFKKIDSSVNTVTLARAGSDTIDGATSFVLSAQYSAVELISDGVSKWFVVNYKA